MTIDQIVANCHGRLSAEHRPDFRVEPGEPGWRVFDCDKPLLHAMTTALDIWSFSPFEPDQFATPPRQSSVIDVHTARNTWMNLGLQGWPAAWRARGASSLEWQWSTQGPELEACITADHDGGERAEWIFRVIYDPSWGRYRYTWDIHARMLTRNGWEPFNMMLAGALTDTPERRRWTHTVSPNLDGRVMRIPNANAMFLMHGHVAMRMITYPRSWVANVAHPSFNPIAIIHHTSVPIEIGFCDQLFDQHLVWTNAGMDDLEADGFYHFRMKVELANLDPAFAASLLERASDPMRVPLAAAPERFAVPFRMRTVNSFEEAIDPWKPVECPQIVLCKSDPDAGAWDPEVAHSGRHSIRLRAAPAGRRELYPTGAVCSVRPCTRYRLEGWIRTSGASPVARLELATYQYTYNNVIASAASPAVRGASDWTRAEVTLDSGSAAYILPKIVVEGDGIAWFDDVLLEECR